MKIRSVPWGKFQMKMGFLICAWNFEKVMLNLILSRMIGQDWAKKVTIGAESRGSSSGSLMLLEVGCPKISKTNFLRWNSDDFWLQTKSTQNDSWEAFRRVKRAAKNLQKFQIFDLADTLAWKELGPVIIGRMGANPCWGVKPVPPVCRGAIIWGGLFDIKTDGGIETGKVWFCKAIRTSWKHTFDFSFTK